MTMTGKEFVAHVAATIEPLFRASEIQTQAYFRNQPDLDEAIFHFKRRMFRPRTRSRICMADGRKEHQSKRCITI